MITLSVAYCIFPGVHWNENNLIYFWKRKKPLQTISEEAENLFWWHLNFEVTHPLDAQSLELKKGAGGGVLGGLRKLFLGGTWGCDKIYVVFYFLVLLPFLTISIYLPPPMPPSPYASMASPLNYQQGIHFFFFLLRRVSIFFQRFFFHRFCLFIKQWPLIGKFVEFEYSPKICHFWRIQVLTKIIILENWPDSIHSPTFANLFWPDSIHSPTFANLVCSDSPDSPTFANLVCSDSPDSRKPSFASITQIWRVWRVWRI